jgi:hypothetical protein
MRLPKEQGRIGAAERSIVIAPNSPRNARNWLRRIGLSCGMHSVVIIQIYDGAGAAGDEMIVLFIDFPGLIDDISRAVDALPGESEVAMTEDSQDRGPARPLS